MRRNKIKKEKLESSSHARSHEEHDLGYYIHDRVELMHQVFSILKYKELKTIAPECVRNLTIGDLQELCTEELLGISSKRLLAILDGAEPPSDTESSSPSPPPEELETISLDSISSDEELLNANENKKKKKRKHHNRRNSKKKDKPKGPETEENTELSKASRAGLTVLELLELQARARAIRAQLQQEQIHKNVQETATVDSSPHTSDNEVEIKEEPPDVVEISSEDEKPDINQLNSKIADPTPAPTTATNVSSNMDVNQNNEKDNAQTVTKRVHDLIITVPQAKTSRKIKLNRNNCAPVPSIDNAMPSSSAGQPQPIFLSQDNLTEKKLDDVEIAADKTKEVKSKKKKKDKKKKIVDKDGSDHDEITLQLSDTEKMDLFEDLDESRKNYDKVSSSSEDSESSSSDSENENRSDDLPAKNPSNNIGSVLLITTQKSNTDAQSIADKNNSTELEKMETVAQIATLHGTVNEDSGHMEHKSRNNNISSVILHDDANTTHGSSDVNIIDSENTFPNKITDAPEQNTTQKSTIGKNEVSSKNEESLSNSTNVNNLNIQTKSDTASDNTVSSTNIEARSIDTTKQLSENETQSIDTATTSVELLVSDEVIEVENTEKNSTPSNTFNDETKQTDKKKENREGDEQSKAPKSTLSDGELSDRESSEIEAMDVRPEIVCISDEETNKIKVMKKKKKKEKKSKKCKKSKPEFLDCHDQNLYGDTNESSEQQLGKGNLKLISNESAPEKLDQNEITEFIDLDSDEVCEIFELSDDSSCSEIEGNLLSKEPTAEEIEALSAKIDEIKREEVVTNEQIQQHEKMLAEKERRKEIDQNVDNISWRDRYLDSNKVKKVLTTANIFNALRKKNKELKNKIELSKKKRDEAIVEEEYTQISGEVNLEEGSIKQYNTLEGLTRFVDPIKEPNSENADNEDSSNKDENVTKEMKKDAKQLLKMYRRLLKYNDVNKQTDPAKKKKKKQKKKQKQDMPQKNVLT